MPIYEYLCGGCSLVFEELVRSSAASVSCPKCGASDVSRQLSTFAAHGLSPGSPATATPNKSGGSCGGCHGGSCSTCH
jgi:putative FmdB family regulatory protein